MLPGYQRKREALDEELQKWKTPDLSIFRVLFTAGKLETHAQLQKQIQPGLLGINENEYYVRLDEADTELFFGKEFDYFLRAKSGALSPRLHMYSDLYV